MVHVHVCVAAPVVVSVHDWHVPLFWHVLVVHGPQPTAAPEHWAELSAGPPDVF